MDRRLLISSSLAFLGAGAIARAQDLQPPAACEPVKQEKPERADEDDNEEIYQEQEHLRPTIYRSVSAPFTNLAPL